MKTGLTGNDINHIIYETKIYVQVLKNILLNRYIFRRIKHVK